MKSFISPNSEEGPEGGRRPASTGQSRIETFRRLRVALGCAWTLAILAACWMPIPQSASGIAEIPNSDKTVHVVIFAVWGVIWASVATRPRGLGLTLIGGAALAALTEIVQGLEFINRSADPVDAMADLIGVLLGVGAAYLAGRALTRSERRDA